jgi:hypothetical protein
LVISDSLATQVPEHSAEDLTDTGNFVLRTETLTSDGLPSLTLRFLLRGDARQQDRIVASTQNALRLFGEWFNAYPAWQLTLVDVGWGRPPRPAREPATVEVASRWLAPARDVSLERSVTAAIARAYFASGSRAPTGGREFGEALAHYAAARAVNELLEGHNVPTHRFFGGFVPFPVESISLTRATRDPRPLVRSYPELDELASSSAIGDIADSLHTLERHIGWPAMQQALAEALADRVDEPRSLTAGDFITIVNRQRGNTIDWWMDAIAPGTTFDYGVTTLMSEPASAGNGYTTHVQVRRNGNPLPRNSFPLDVVTRFGDGSAVDERWDGSAEDVGFTYHSNAPAIAAAVDPHAVLLLDSNRLNNIRVAHVPASREGWRLTLNWTAWLQQLTLTCLALI